jgi:hypothetical protein
VIELPLIAAKAGLDISETFPIRELGETHAKELVPAGKRYDLVAALVPLDTFLKFVLRKVLHQLRQNCFPNIHMPSPQKEVKEYGIYEISNSNRKMAFSLNSEILSCG